MDEKKGKQSAEQPPESAGKDASPRKTMGDGYVPRIDYALRAKLANQPGQFDPLPIDDPVAAALRSSHDFDTALDAEDVTLFEARPRESGSCPACGALNSPEAIFCSGCGVPTADNSMRRAPGQHHYHHHYHHHYVNGGTAAPIASVDRPAITTTTAPTSSRTPLPGGGLSKAEAAVRKLAQDWAQACNTKHLDDLVELYGTDGLVLRPNVPLVRGTAAIREFFFGVLEAGLGDVEMDAVRVEILGDTAYEAGRCKMLVPTPVGKRREERGKYLIMSMRNAGEWKIISDSWSTDLSLGTEVGGLAPPAASRPGRKP